jgi:hypothetical protein
MKPISEISFTNKRKRRQGGDVTYAATWIRNLAR